MTPSRGVEGKSRVLRGGPAGRPRWPRLRPSLFELKIAGALVLAAVVPLAAALWLARTLTEENLAVALNPRVVARLEATPALYGDLFQSRKQLYAEQARALLVGLPSNPSHLEAFLASAVEHTPRLRRAALLDEDGAVLFEAEAKEPNPDGEWRPATAGPVAVPDPARHGLPAGAALECTFAVEARFFADLSEARDLAEVYHSAEALRADIQRSYVRAFSALLGAWALVAGVAGALLARRTTQRLSELVGAVRQLARGNLQVQVEAGSARDEVAGLARAFNSMVREVRESRDRIVYLEKISGWQEVARRLAHEIKNPLTPIQLAFQQLEARYRTGPARDPDFSRLLADAGDIVREEIGTLQRLVEEFSSFAKLPEAQLVSAELGLFVEEFIRTSPQLAEEAELEVVRSGDCPVSIDRTLMRRVLTNLVRNAITASRPQRASIHLTVARREERALLAVADEGPGVPEALRERIFDPYFTTRHEGTGLGLAIVKKIVLQHGGDISVGARPGGGA
ncbi:MAG TPA: ATP-binding protein, partial [Anaeromyxobacteraceae bacterium]|nr:ATP-binding protein [Anaeromyxobacteraceae bacterium]